MNDLAQSLFDRAQLDTLFESMAQNAATYYMALIEARVPEPLVEQLTRDYMWQFWASCWAGRKND